MCELAVVLEHYTHPAAFKDAPEMNAKLPKRGHVIEVMDNGANWGAVPPRKKEWVIIRITNLLFRDGLAYLDSMPGFSEENVLLGPRRLRIDVDHPKIAAAIAALAPDADRIITFRKEDIADAFLQEEIPRPPHEAAP